MLVFGGRGQSRNQQIEKLVLLFRIDVTGSSKEHKFSFLQYKNVTRLIDTVG